MASSQTLNSVLQYSYRAQKDLGLVNGPPSYEPASGFEKPETAARATLYSADGSLLALVLPNSIRILSTATNQVHREIQVSAVEVKFSPKATFLSTWERPIKQEDGAQHKNLRVWAVESGEEVVSFTQTRAEGWEIQFTPNESHAVRLSGPELQVFNPSQWSAGVQSKLRLPDGNPITAFFLSPSAVNPSVLVFVPEKKGAPASVRIYNLLTLSGPATCQKTFFKADTVRAKWNQQGTMVLVLTHTDVDKTNKSYYGETGLYLLSAAGNFDSRITLDKEGPVHDFAWNPSSKEFGIVYGFMPAKTTLFDQRVKPVYEFGSNPYNFISWSPQGRFVALAGFGNLQGKIDVFDRKTLNKVSTIDAPNTSCFEWAPSGDVILTAILSPRLRVDNGVKIWYVDGKLLHVQDQEELYQVNWRPFATTPPFPAQIPPCPAPSSAASSVVKPAAVKPAGAYRPPGAQGRAAPSIFNRREDDTPPLSSPNRSGSHTPNHHYNERGGHGGHGDRGGHGHGHGHGHSHGHGANGYGGHGYGRGRGGYGGDGRRYVPGAPPSRESPTPNSNSNANNNNNNGPAGGPAGEGGRKKKNNQKKKGPAGAQGQEQDGYVVPEPPAIEAVPSTSNTVAAGGADDAGGEGGLDPIQKKIRNLNKKLKAIEELKDKAKRGEKLETTQHKKISTEAEIRKELQAILGQAA